MKPGGSGPEPPGPLSSLRLASTFDHRRIEAVAANVPSLFDFLSGREPASYLVTGTFPTPPRQTERATFTALRFPVSILKVLGHRRFPPEFDDGMIDRPRWSCDCVPTVAYHAVHSIERKSPLPSPSGYLDVFLSREHLACLQKSHEIGSPAVLRPVNGFPVPSLL